MCCWTVVYNGIMCVRRVCVHVMSRSVFAAGVHVLCVVFADGGFVIDNMLVEGLAEASSQHESM